MSWNMSNYVRKPSVVSENTQWNQQDIEKMETFKKLVKAIENDMEKVLQQHEENPEEHPQYDEEWEKFSNRRHKELQLEGKDVSKYSLIAEWVPFWAKRVKEMHNEELENKKVLLRQGLGIAVDYNDDSRKTNRSRSPYRRNSNGEPASKQRKVTGEEGRASVERSMHYQQGGRPMSPCEKPPYHHQYYDQYKPPKQMQDATSEPVIVRSDGKDDDCGIHIMTVLRLLTAMEEKLGSLGPKVNDLLAQALVMEKAEVNSSKKLLDDDVNCVLLETAKEKLKGQLLAGVVDNIQERAYKRAIEKTTSLIHLVSTRKTETSLNTQPDPVKVADDGTIDGDAIAREVATMLFMQGKTDVSQEQLEELMTAMFEAAKASQQSDKPSTTPGLLNRISGISESPKKYHEVNLYFDEADYKNAATDTLTSFTNLSSNFSKSTSSSPSVSQSSSFFINQSTPAPAFTRPPPSFNRPPPAFDRPPPGFGTPVPGSNRQGFDKQSPWFNRPAPAVNRPPPSFDRPVPSFNRPVVPRAGSYKPTPGLNNQGPGFAKPGTGFNSIAVNSEVKLYKCSKCEYSAKLIDDVSKHIIMKHSTHKPLTCDSCDYVAVNRNQLKNHTRSNHIKEGPFKCDECDYSAVTGAYLTRHKFRKHSEEGPFNCDECGYSAMSSHYLEMHIQTNHSEENHIECEENE